MKSTYTPAERLRLDRQRKTRQREQLRARGLRLHQVWMSDEAWGELLTLMKARREEGKEECVAAGTKRNATEAYSQAEQAMS